MTSVEITTETRFLDVRLTEEERRARADRAAESSHKAAQLRHKEEQLKEQAKAAKTDATLLEEEAGRYLATYRSGTEGRQVECRTEYDETTKQVSTVRLDTGELIEGPRTPTAEELLRVQQVTIEQHQTKGKRRGSGASA